MHKIISTFKGVQVHGKDEAEYFTEIVRNIKTPEEYTFFFSVWDQPIGTAPPNSIVFSTSDEYHRQPASDHLQENVVLLFKNYFPFETVCDKRVFPFPLGYLTNFSGTNSVPINQRHFDYSFSGTFNGNGRDKMYRQLELRKNDGKKKFWKMTDSWGTGLSMNQYSDLLTQTKIALCPSGYVSTESFRIFEAARCGCVLIVDAVPTNLWYYDGFPGIIVKDWDDLSVLETLLADTDMMEDISKRTVEWYDRCISPKAVAAYVEQRIQELST